MPIAMPNLPESLTYLVAAAIALTIFAALFVLSGGDPVGAIFVLACAGAIHRLIGRNLATIVNARDVAATVAVLFVLCAVIDLAIDAPYQAIVFLLAAAALGFAYLLLQQGTTPVELRLGGLF